ncbi:unnamed protein product [Ceutorhynchus assimilis]|uniref:Uncharacterized protein n=1 Tax=Ceutorhynchus assimilis TaxID=467358 RepID=A0A9N9QIH9_9CUCU|nr:unnamed protein product [Ceutorhynchus assimilis]
MSYSKYQDDQEAARCGTFHDYHDDCNCGGYKHVDRDECFNCSGGSPNTFYCPECNSQQRGRDYDGRCYQCLKRANSQTTAAGQYTPEKKYYSSQQSQYSPYPYQQYSPDYKGQSSQNWNNGGTHFSNYHDQCQCGRRKVRDREVCSSCSGGNATQFYCPGCQSTKKGWKYDGVCYDCQFRQ